MREESCTTFFSTPIVIKCTLNLILKSVVQLSTSDITTDIFSYFYLSVKYHMSSVVPTRLSRETPYNFAPYVQIAFNTMSLPKNAKITVEYRITYVTKRHVRSFPIALRDVLR